MDTTLTVLSIIGLILGAIFIWIFAVRLGAFTVLVQCPRCKLRIASVKVGIRTPTPTEGDPTIPRGGYYLGRYICGECWADLKEVGLDTDGNWMPGTVVKYVKDTPGSLAVFISLGALIVSVFALLR